MIELDANGATTEASDWQMRISPRAVLTRVNRRLASELEGLRHTRSDRARADLGDVYYLDLHRNVILGHHVDLEAFARVLGVLRPYERLDDITAS